MELQNFINSQTQTMSSREIAQLTGKEHRSVLRDIDNLNDNYEKLGLHKIVQSSYLNEQGREFREMLLSKIQTMDLITGYNVELRIKVNRRWEELENRNSAQTLSRIDLARMVIEQEEEKQKLIEENNLLKPKAIIAEALNTSTESVLVRDVAYQLKKNGFNIGQDRLFEILRQHKLIHKKGTKPTQKALELDIFEVQERMVQKGTTLEPTFTTKVKGKGQIYILNKFLSGQWKTL